MPESTALTETTPISISPDEEHEWDQREGETFEQYEKFRTYLLLPREDRSVGSAFKHWNEAHPPHEGPQRKDAQRSIAQFKEIAADQSWKERAQAYDRLVDAKILERLANRRLQALVEMADLGQAMRRKAAEALKVMVAVSREQGSDPETGIPVMLVQSKLTATEIAKLAQTGTELEQLSLGAPTDRISLVGGQVGQGDTTTEGISGAKAELMRRIEGIRKRRDAANTLEAEVVDSGDLTYDGENFRVEDVEVVIMDGTDKDDLLDDYIPSDHE